MEWPQRLCEYVQSCTVPLKKGSEKNSISKSSEQRRSSSERICGNAPQIDGGVEVIGRLFTANEGFRGQIKEDQMAQCVAEVHTHTPE